MCSRFCGRLKMLSEKIQTLSVEDIVRYKEKIRVINGIDPYTFEYDPKVLPITVDYDSVLCYLLNTLSFRTGEPVQNRKSLDAYKSFERGFIKQVQGKRCDQIFAVMGKVKYERRIQNYEFISCFFY